MMAAELIEGEAAVNAANGVYWIRQTFGCPVYAGLYIVWLCALWFHLTHGIWSAMQTLGVSGKVWFNRWRCIGNIYATIVVLMFVAVVVVFALQGMGCCGSCCFMG
jgi:succinate dehydrogenase / fumarate reductase cytochrome b subunit